MLSVCVCVCVGGCCGCVGVGCGCCQCVCVCVWGGYVLLAFGIAMQLSSGGMLVLEQFSEHKSEQLWDHTEEGFVLRYLSGNTRVLLSNLVPGSCCHVQVITWYSHLLACCQGNQF